MTIPQVTFTSNRNQMEVFCDGLGLHVIRKRASFHGYRVTAVIASVEQVGLFRIFMQKLETVVDEVKTPPNTPTGAQ